MLTRSRQKKNNSNWILKRLNWQNLSITLREAQGINCEPPTRNPECVNIRIPKGDAIFRDREVDFIELERDAPSKYS